MTNYMLQYQPMVAGESVRFTTTSRFKDFVKGEVAVISQVVSRYPEASENIYIVTADKKRMWCSESEVVPWNQLSLL